MTMKPRRDDRELDKFVETGTGDTAVRVELDGAPGTTDVGGKPSLDVNVTNITINPDDDAIETRGMSLSLRVDKVSTSNVMYIGEALPGALEASAVWRIFIIDKTTTVMKKRYADGNGNYDNIWANRASLTYT